MTILKEIRNFLLEVKNIFDKNIFEKYKWSLDLFKDYLIHYSDFSKEILKLKSNENFLNKNIEEIDEKYITNFLNIFLIKKISSTYNELDIHLKVLKEFYIWLLDKRYISNDFTQKILKTIKSFEKLPYTAKLSDLLFDFASEINFNNYNDYEIIVNGYFSIIDIFENYLVLQNIKDKNEYKPIIITKEISKYSLKGMILSLEIGLKNKNWYILESGNVFLKMIE